MTNSEKTAKAQESAQQWLNLIDSSQYIDSWSTAAPYFQNNITATEWARMLQGVRQPLGATISRQLEAKKYKTSVPGSPDGEYVVIQYQTSFSNKQSAVETVTSMLDPEGIWKVAGYFIR